MRRALAIAVAGAFIVGACSSDSGGSVKAWCESVQKFVDVGDPFEGDPEEFADRLAETRNAVDALADDAPSEISDDARTAADGFIELIDALADVDLSDEEAVNEELAPLEETDSEVEEASDNVNEFSMAECGIDLNEGGG